MYAVSGFGPSHGNMRPLRDGEMDRASQPHHPVTLRHVTFTYAGATEPALRDVTLAILLPVRSAPLLAGQAQAKVRSARSAPGLCRIFFEVASTVMRLWTDYR